MLKKSRPTSVKYISKTLLYYFQVQIQFISKIMDQPENSFFFPFLYLKWKIPSFIYNMAVPANFSSPDRDKFNHCYERLVSFVYRDEDSAKTDLNILLDQLNSIEYGIALVTEEVSFPPTTWIRVTGQSTRTLVSSYLSQFLPIFGELVPIVRSTRTTQVKSYLIWLTRTL